MFLNFDFWFKIISTFTLDVGFLILSLLLNLIYVLTNNRISCRVTEQRSYLTGGITFFQSSLSFSSLSVSNSLIIYLIKTTIYCIAIKNYLTCGYVINSKQINAHSLFNVLLIYKFSNDNIEKKYKFMRKNLATLTGLDFGRYIKRSAKIYNCYYPNHYISTCDITSILLVLSLAIGNERGEVLGSPFITFLAPGLIAMQVIQHLFLILPHQL
jgi:hypothetical protein